MLCFLCVFLQQKLLMSVLVSFIKDELQYLTTLCDFTFKCGTDWHADCCFLYQAYIVSYTSRTHPN